MVIFLIKKNIMCVFFFLFFVCVFFLFVVVVVFVLGVHNTKIAVLYQI